jgi:fatty-acid desaturase
MSKLVRTVSEIKPDYGVIIWMAAIHIIALAGIFCFSWENFAVMMVANFMTGCIGITLCYHRLLTHRTYQVPKWFERVLATFGTLALQGSPLEWVAHHRMHHAGSDTASDPHDASQGFYHSHWGWLFKYTPEFDDPAKLRKFGRDLVNDPYYRLLDTVWMQILIQVIFGLILGAIGGLPWIIWGVFVRLVVVYHSTWFVNSASHIWGYKNYQVNDRARNNWWVALLTWGEGWHNNHHAHDNIAPAGHKWWEVDITYMLIRLMKFVGLAKNVKTFKSLEADRAAAAAAGSGFASPAAPKLYE